MIDSKDYCIKLFYYCIGILIYLIIFDDSTFERLPVVFIIMHVIVFNLYYFFILRKYFK